MCQILILTKNILAEQKIQQKLQTLNYEVCCSTLLLECYWEQKRLDFINTFQYVILSESICGSEVTELVSLLKKISIGIIRKVEAKLTEADQQCLEKGQINAIITTADSVDELRECLHNLMRKNNQTVDKHKVISLSGKVSLIDSHSMQELGLELEETERIIEAFYRLSQTEIRVLSVLIEAGNQVVTREELCFRIWNEKSNKSHLSSLSSTITRIKHKFEQTGLEQAVIKTLWRKGYLINQELLEKIQKDETFNKIVVSS